jgi:hypothetical protein
MPILAGQTARAISLNQGTYTPVLTADTTNPTLGAGSVQSGWWKRIDELIVGNAVIRFGTSGTAAGSGTYSVSLPFAANTTFETASGGWGTGSVLGNGGVRDNSAVTLGSRGIHAQLATTTTVILFIADGTNLAVTNAVPFTWTVSDAISINFRYQADPAGL